MLGTKLAGQTQRFYFDTKSGVILPGDTLKFPFIFKSPNAGIFTETWELMTRPTLCGGAPVSITLRGNGLCFVLIFASPVLKLALENKDLLK